MLVGLKHCLLILLLLCTGYSQAQKRILFITSNVGTMNGTANGTYLTEITFPFDYFIKQGYEIDIVSPQGRAIPMYHKFDTVKAMKDIMANKLFVKKTTNTLTTAEAKKQQYHAVFFPGGYGQFWDIANDSEVHNLVRKIYEKGGVVGASGHGISSFVNVILSNGSYLVKDIEITCFPTWAEKKWMTESNYGKVLPFDMIEELKKRGAIVKTSIAENVPGQTQVCDTAGRIVTGAFADDCLWVAETMHQLLSNKKRD